MVANIQIRPQVTIYVLGYGRERGVSWALTCATCSSSSGLPFTLRCISLISCWYSFLRCSSCFLYRRQSYRRSVRPAERHFLPPTRRSYAT